MKILLFDWHDAGHHGIYIDRVCQALAQDHDVTVATAETLCERLSLPPNTEIRSLGPSRPRSSSRSDDRELAGIEIGFLRQMIASSDADAAFHLYSDPVVEWLAGAEPFRVPVSTTTFFARAHYPFKYRSLLAPRDSARALLLERAGYVWRRRKDAGPVFALDPYVAHLWSKASRAPVFWFPEPPLPPDTPSRSSAPNGCILYGALAPRKGVDRLAAALSTSAEGITVTFAGPVIEGFQSELETCANTIREGGATIHLRLEEHDENSGLHLLADSNCAVLPYRRHHGMSRVLLEAAAVGTPSVVHDYGLLAQLVNKHGIGAAVDCTDRRTMRRALDRFMDGSAAEALGPALRRFAKVFEGRAFASVLENAFPSCGSRDIHNGSRATTCTEHDPQGQDTAFTSQ